MISVTRGSDEGRAVLVVTTLHEGHRPEDHLHEGHR
jgi:hypothetical protein